MTIRKIGESSRSGLSNANARLQQSLAKLSTGSRITKASDDAAGLAIADALRSEARTASVASRNTGDGQSLIAIQQGALSSLSDINVRQQELSIQAANGTLSDSQRAALDQEFQALSAEAERIVASTEFNGVKVFSGESVQIQAGTDGSSNSTLSVEGLSSSALTNSELSIASASSALTSLDVLKEQQSALSQANASTGSAAARLETANNQLQSRQIGSLAAESRIRDVDVAAETANLAASRILQQSGAALSAQANLLSGRVLDLLR